MKAVAPTIVGYNNKFSETENEVCEVLFAELEKFFKKVDGEANVVESKIWHGAPVWFINGNPIVGYSKQKSDIRLMFWSGADFKHKGLKPGTGKFKDASIFYGSVEEIKKTDLKQWLAESVDVQWDYKNIVKRKGVLVKL